MLANLDGQPAGPVLVPRSGGGGEHRWEVLFWMWPLPKEDPFRIVVEWPSRGIDLSLVDVPVAPLVEAASRCEELWPAGEGHDGRVSDFT